MAQTTQSCKPAILDELADVTSSFMLDTLTSAAAGQKATDQLMQNLTEAGISCQQACARSVRDWTSAVHEAQQAWVQKGCQAMKKALWVLL